MKKITFLFIIMNILIFSLAFKKSTINSFPLFGKLIVLDPGHGGIDPGAVFDKQTEKDYNLVFSQTLKIELEELGADVIMTRESDYDLSTSANHRKKSDFDNRILLINSSQADLYISLHLNYLSDTKYHGAQVFYSGVNDHNKVLADIIQEYLNKFLSQKKNIKTISNSKYMFNKISIPGVLIEYGFITNAEEIKKLNDKVYLQDLAKTITRGIVSYYT